MGLAILGGHIFQIDPNAIEWNITIKSSYKDTIGGRVVQVFGAEFSDMTVTGQFGSGGTVEQQRLLYNLTAMSKVQSAAPMHFSYPPKGWDFTVNVLAFKGDGPSSVALRTGLIPRWSITMAIVNDNVELKTVAVDAYLNRISQGLGWKANKFNGPGNWEDVQAALAKEGVSTIHDLIVKRTAIANGSNTSGPSGGAGTPGSPPPDGGTTIAPAGGGSGPGNEVDNPPAGKTWARGPLTIDQMADLVVTAGITDAHTAALFIAIAKRESGWNSTSHNPVPPDNSWGLWQINVIDGAMLASNLAIYRAKDLTDPWTCARTMMFLSRNGTNLGPWVVDTNGNPTSSASGVSQYIPEALAAVQRRLSR